MMNLRILACLSMFAAACAGEPTDYSGEIDPVGPTVRDQLRGRQVLSIAPMQPDGAGSLISADVSGSLAGEVQSVALPVLGGHVAARAVDDGRVVVEELVVDLNDVVLDEQTFPPNGLWLSGLQLRLAGPVVAEASWTADHEAAALVASLDLQLDWGVVLSDGEVHPLATQTLRDLELQLDIGRQGPAGIQMGIAGFAEGQVWRWSSFVEVSNVGIDLVAEKTAID